MDRIPDRFRKVSLQETVWRRTCEDFKQKHARLEFWAAEVFISTLIAAITSNPADLRLRTCVDSKTCQ